MFPVSMNPYFHPTLSYPQSPFINPEWAMRAYAHHAWDPYSAQAYYRGSYPNFGSFGIDPSALFFHQAANNPSLHHLNALSQVPVNAQTQGSIGAGSPNISQSQIPIGFVPPTASQGQLPIGMFPHNVGSSFDQVHGPVDALDKRMERFGYTNAQVESSLARLLPAVHSPTTR